MYSRITSLAMSGALAAICWGCGGSGGGTGSSTSVMEAVIGPGYTGGIASPTDSGSLVGDEYVSSANVQVGAYWLTLNKIVTVPNVNSQTHAESVTAVSPSGAFVAGAYGIESSGTAPFLAYVYNLKSGQMHPLKISVSTGGVWPITVDDEGNVVGAIRQPSTLDQVFNYNLSKDSYTAAPIPNYAATVTPVFQGQAVEINAYSPNYAFAGGYAEDPQGRYLRAVVWNTGTGAYQLIDVPGQNSMTDGVSNDGTVATYYDNSAEQECVWIQGSQPRTVLSIVNKAGIGLNWSDTNWVLLSPNGNYLTCIGNIANGRLSANPIVVRLR